MHDSCAIMSQQRPPPNDQHPTVSSIIQKATRTLSWQSKTLSCDGVMGSPLISIGSKDTQISLIDHLHEMKDETSNRTYKQALSMHRQEAQLYRELIAPIGTLRGRRYQYEGAKLQVTRRPNLHPRCMTTISAYSL
jgi:hypothetical protein